MATVPEVGRVNEVAPDVPNVIPNPPVTVISAPPTGKLLTVNDPTTFTAPVLT